MKQNVLTSDDIRTLSRICFPVLQNHEPDTLKEHLGIAATLEEDKAGQVILDALVERANHLPSPILSEINRLLAASRLEAIRTFFAEAGELPIDPQGATAPRLTDIFPEARFPRPRPTPDELERVPIDRDAVATALGPDGSVALHMGRYEHRAGQIEMAAAVVDAFNQSKCLLVEAGTGIGKSLAYLVPAIMRATANRLPVVISTNTKNLQSQLFEKDLPLLREALEVDFAAALIKGRMNYLCLRKLTYLLKEVDQELELDDNDQADILHVLGWAAGTDTGDFAESSVLEQPTIRDLRGRLASSAEECPGRSCPHFRRCFLRKARAKAHAADVIVANHSLVFAEININTSALPPYVDVIFDEAHNIEEAATRHFSIELSASKLRFITRRLLRRRGRRGRGRGKGFLPSMLTHLDSDSFQGTETQREKARDLTEAMLSQVEALQTSSGRLFDAMGDLLEKPTRNLGSLRITAKVKESTVWSGVEAARAVMDEELRSLAEQADNLAEVLHEVDADELPFHMDQIQELVAVSVRLKEMLQDLHVVLEAKEEGYVYWVETSGRRPDSVRAWGAPITVGSKLAEAFYAQKESVVLTSATLTVKGSFDFFKSRLGFDHVAPERCMELNAGSPFDYEQQCRVLVPMFLPEPNEAGGHYAAELGALLAQVFRLTHGRGMVLFTSYSMLRETTEALEQDLEYDAIPVLAQGTSGSRENITSLFKRNMEAVLMGTHSFWEGVDVVGETLSCLVIARLPFAVFTDPIQVARAEKIEAEGGDAFRAYSLPNAVIRFRQGFGRLIRHRTDRGVVIVTDRRIMTKSYGASFRKSLPTRTISLSDRDPFLAAIEECIAGT
jgi:ATP-dependent DNA helicase DinG